MLMLDCAALWSSGWPLALIACDHGFKNSSAGLNQCRESWLVRFNPLTTNDNCSHHPNLAACYQLALSVLKTGSAQAEKVGWGGGGFHFWH